MRNEVISTVGCVPSEAPRLSTDGVNSPGIKGKGCYPLASSLLSPVTRTSRYTRLPVKHSSLCSWIDITPNEPAADNVRIQVTFVFYQESNSFNR